MSAVLTSLQYALADAHTETAQASAEHDVAMATGTADERRAAARALLLAVDYERQVRGALHAEMTSRAQARSAGVRTQMETWTELLRTGIDPVKAAMVARDAKGAT